MFSRTLTFEVSGEMLWGEIVLALDGAAKW
jgi:hypothetical protein